ncbi:MAG TPA: threonine/serine dehydratase [Gemmatimonadaceae bacterium]|nr:threonine/serine dehydratase [Gemmatimonadaceae bacterium]
MPPSATAASPAPPDTRSLVSLDEIRAAARVLRNIAVRTPLLPADDLSAQLGGGSIFVKPEMLQRGGAFKFRGAYTFLAGLSDAERARGVIAPSSGNHAQAVAFAARIFGIHATLVMPTTVTSAKRSGVERLGGRVELAGLTTADRMERAQQLAKETGSVLVPPYDDARIIAGQGTVGLEIVEDLPDVGTVLVPVGGGGLSAGVATAVKLLAPNARVIGVEPVGAPKLTRARAAGAPVRLDATGGMADGLLATQVGTIPFAHHEAYVDEVVTVDDADLSAAMRYLLDRLKIVTEPSGAITIAALQSGKVEPRGKTVAVLSGGNIEWDGLRDVLGDG